MFGLHRFMIRLREGRDMRILDASVAVTSRADVHWAYDTFGNAAREGALKVILKG